MIRSHTVRLPPKRFRHFCYGVAIGVVLNSCARPERLEIAPSDRPATPEAIAKWREERQITVASDDEVAAVKHCGKEFANHKASSPDGKLKVVFHRGKRIGDIYHYSTTSTYTLVDANGKSLAEAPSCVTGYHGDNGNDSAADQAAWFAPDGKHVVVYEYTNEGLGPPPSTIVLHEDEDNLGAWKFKFLELPLFTGGIHDEGAHSKCLGILGDELLFDANTQDGKVSKKKIREFKETYPFPFTVG